MQQCNLFTFISITSDVTCHHSKEKFLTLPQQPAAMSSNKFDALGSDDSEVEESLNNHHQMEVEKTQTKLIWYTGPIYILATL